MERKDLLPTSEEMGYDKDCTCSPDEDNILERLREQLGYDNISEMICTHISPFFDSKINLVSRECM